MTQRERSSSGAVAEAALPPRADAPGMAPPSWEELYRGSSPAQQAELLAVARRQGILYAGQVPTPTGNGFASDPPRQLLSRLAHNHLDLPPLCPPDTAPIDAALDESQRDAVAKALHTPDLFLLQGLPGTGKSRVVAEVVTQAVRRGERVLLAAPTMSAVDRVLEEVAEREGVCAVRCNPADEKADDVPATLRALAIPDRVRKLHDESLPAARQEAQHLEAYCGRLQQDDAVLTRGHELSAQLAQLDQQAQALQERAATLAADVERAAGAVNEADAFSARLAGLAATRQQTATRIEEARRAGAELRAAEERGQKEITPELEALRSLNAAKQSGRWWSGAWWQATFAGNLATRLPELEKRHQDSAATLARIQDEDKSLDQELQQAEQTYQNSRQHEIAAEVTRRRAELDQQTAALEQARAVQRQQWAALCQELHADTTRPAEPTAAAVHTARQSWQQACGRAQERLEFARQWLAGLEASAPKMAQRLTAEANLVAATTTGLAADPHFGPAGPLFDVLIVEHAQQITESEFLGVARRARRWVLVAESPHTETKPAAAPAGFFQRLWQRLHCDPRALPYAWSREQDRLCCRLRALAAEQRQALESEHVADFPEIELRILSQPRNRPVLAEVVFPASMSIVQAKEYIFQELQELPVCASSHSLRWTTDADAIRLHLAAGDCVHGATVALEHGVRELVSGAGDSWHTCCLEFERRAGWNRSRADDWVRRHLAPRDLGRTAYLDVPHRMHPELAALVSGWVFGNAYRVPAVSSNGHGPPLEFISVPVATPEPLPAKTANGRRGPAPAPTKTKPSRGGAGLELELADLRHRDRLPSELRPELPGQGLVNYLEAQAIVRALERLAAEGSTSGQSNGRRGAVGVVALYPTQAQLIRCLIRRSPALAGAALDIHVDVPAGFRERECSILLVSLTRSHGHRAVTFGDGPHMWALALTRAQKRLMVFGDPGTLARRAEWEGPVDHLDEAAAALERNLVVQLLQSLHGAPAPARLHPEGSRP